MSTKRTLFAIIFSFSFFQAPAQQKRADLRGDISFFPADSTIQPAGSSVIVLTTHDFNQSAENLIAVLNKKGVPACKIIVTRNNADKNLNELFQHMRVNAHALKITDPKIGILTVGELNVQPSTLDPAAFIGMINPGSMSKIKISQAIPFFIDDDGKDGANTVRFYSSLARRSGKLDLHLHQQPANDSTQITELINWMSGLGLLKPISTEKTKTQKQQEDWKNFMKIIDDRLHNDWAWLKRYESDNDKMLAPAKDEKRVVFLGNSITEGWINQDPDFFKINNYINRGIGGQTTPQMLVRFREDVVNLHPRVVIILAGINDIAQNTGPSRLENVAGNIISMAEIAKANNIRVIFCSVLPALGFPWHPGINPVPSIIRLNEMLKDYAENNKLQYVDYYSAVMDENKGFRKGLAIDGVHPNLSGYKIMEPLAKAAIDKALR